MTLGLCTRADLRRSGAAIAVLVIIAGVAGGTTLAAIAGARRTETSYERLVEAENGAEVFMFAQGELDPADLAELRTIPGATVGSSTIVLLSSAATGIDRRHDLGVIVAADADSLAMLHPHHLDGRLPAPDHPEEVVVNELMAQQLDLEPGDTVEVVGPTEQAFACLESLECDGDLLNEPFTAVVSGVMRRSDDLAPDAFNGALLYAGPGMNEVAPPGYLRSVTVLEAKLAGGRAGAGGFVEEMERRFPERFGIEVDDPTQSSISASLDVESRSLLVFALFAGVAGLVATLQAFARHLAAGREDRRVLAALGLTRRDRAGVMLRSALLAVGGATALAVAVAIVGSSFLPVGLARRTEPDPGIDMDVLVLGVGAAAMAVLLLVAFGLLTWRAAGRDTADLSKEAPLRAGRLSALPIVAAVGVDLAAPRLRRAGTVSTLGAVVCVVAAVATATAAAVVAASNGDLQEDPELYGQPWDANVAMPPEKARTVADELAADDAISALALAAGGGIELAGPGGRRAELIAVGFELLEGEMEPALLDGRAPRTSTEVALGSNVFDQLAVAIGDDVTSTDGTKLKVVGRAIIPIVDADSPEDGALLTLAGFERYASPDVQGESTEMGVAFDVRPGSDLDAVLDDQLGPVVALAGAPARTPSDVTTLAGVGRLPVAIGVFTAGLAVAALCHALLVVVRRRRGDLATLRALGLRRRQTAAAVLCAAITVLVAGVVLGLPLGVAAGRVVWSAIAASIHVVAASAVPATVLLVIAAISVVATTAAAVWPAAGVLRLRLIEVLRTE